MIFSNNMEYDDSDPEPIQGAFYASSSYSNPVFNYFREEELFNLTNLLKPLSDETEIAVLKDNNLEVIRTNPEFQTNKDHNCPTNRLCTALLSRDRLALFCAMRWCMSPNRAESRNTSCATRSSSPLKQSSAN